MGDSLFDIFGTHTGPVNHGRIARKLIPGEENFGKVYSSATKNFPTKQNTSDGPLKKIDSQKKSFLANKGAALQATPLKTLNSPRNVFGSVNKQPLKIYSDHKAATPAKQTTTKGKKYDQDIEFKRKPRVINDNYNHDMFDNMPGFNVDNGIDRFMFGKHCTNTPRCTKVIKSTMICDEDIFQNEPDDLFKENDTMDEFNFNDDELLSYY